MRIDPSGDVGIGTNNPVDSTKLDVQGDMYLKGKLHLSVSGALNTYSNMVDQCQKIEGIDNYFLDYYAGNTNEFAGMGGHRFFQSHNGNKNQWVEAFTIDSSSRIGINQSAPQYTLDVNGTAKFSGDVIFDTTIQANNGIAVNNGQNGGTGIHLYNASNTDWGIYMGQSGASRSFSGGNAVAGCGFSSFSTRFRSDNVSNGGFIFENNSEVLLASIRGNDGLSYFKSAVIGGDGSQLHHNASDSALSIHGKLRFGGGDTEGIVFSRTDGTAVHSIYSDTSEHLYIKEDRGAFSNTLKIGGSNIIQGTSTSSNSQVDNGSFNIDSYGRLCLNPGAVTAPLAQLDVRGDFRAAYDTDTTSILVVLLLDLQVGMIRHLLLI